MSLSDGYSNMRRINFTERSRVKTTADHLKSPAGGYLIGKQILLADLSHCGRFGMEIGSTNLTCFIMSRSFTQNFSLSNPVFHQ